MSARLPRHRFLYAALSVLLLGFTASAEQPDLTSHLRDSYQNKILVLRGFYSGKHLHYDSTGAPTSTEKSGDWTTDAFIRVNHIDFSHRRVTLKIDRIALADDYRSGFQFQPKHWPHANIEVDLGGDPSLQQIDAAMAKIFLTSHDDLAELVPDYWKQCVADAETGKGTNCHFSPDVLAIPGLTRVAANSTPDLTPNNKVVSCIGKTANCAQKRISPPRLIHHIEPEFSERARRERFQGVVTLGLFVDTDGLPKGIHVLNPLGYGLDAQAVRAVSQWRFQPAQKDGQPVAAEIGVEVDFHLY